MKFQLSIVFFMLLLLTSCASGVEYNKVYLSDEDMDLGTKSVQNPEVTSDSYREGASGANGGKTGGGCGCN